MENQRRSLRQGFYTEIGTSPKLPGKSGIELYEEIEELDRPLAGRVIFVTGDVMGLDTREFFSRTKACYITKPFHLEELDSDINRMLAQSI